MDKSQFIEEVKKRLPQIPDDQLMQGINEFAQQHPDLGPEEALQALDMFLQKNPQHGSMGNFLGSTNKGMI